MYFVHKSKGLPIHGRKIWLPRFEQDSNQMYVKSLTTSGSTLVIL